MKKILCVISVLLIGIVGVNSLQCYVCENCPTPTEADLVSCDDPVTTAPEVSTAAPSSTSAAPSTSSPAPSSSSTALSSSSSAPSSSSATPSSSTTAPSTSSATPSSSSAVPSSSTTAPSTSTAAPSSTSAAPVLPTAVPPQTTAAPVQPTENPPNVTVRRYKRSILPLVNSNKTACNCKNETGCNCDSSLSRNSTNAEHVCFKVVMKKNNVIVRGCAPATLDSKAPCQVEDVVAAVTSCSTCDTDKCNDGYTTQFSVYMLVATVGVILFK